MRNDDFDGTLALNIVLCVSKGFTTLSFLELFCIYDSCIYSPKNVYRKGVKLATKSVQYESERELRTTDKLYNNSFRIKGIVYGV